MPATLTVARRFCGPPESGNGGYVAGLLAERLGGTVEVTLRRPPPLDRPLTVTTTTEGLDLSDGELLVAEAVHADVELAIPGGTVAIDAARAATASCPTLVHPDWHPFPGCFVCGPERDPGDGLRIFPGPIDETRYATTWTPRPDADIAVVWASLDCPSSSGIYAFPDYARPEGAYVLGRFAARVAERPRAGEEVVVVAWRVAREGRKLFAGSALQTSDGRVLAAARATWLTI